MKIKYTHHNYKWDAFNKILTYFSITGMIFLALSAENVEFTVTDWPILKLGVFVIISSVFLGKIILTLVNLFRNDMYERKISIHVYCSTRYRAQEVLPKLQDIARSIDENPEFEKEKIELIVIQSV